jgi:hypothetical protein
MSLSIQSIKDRLVIVQRRQYSSDPEAEAMMLETLEVCMFELLEYLSVAMTDTDLSDVRLLEVIKEEFKREGLADFARDMPRVTADAYDRAILSAMRRVASRPRSAMRG